MLELPGRNILCVAGATVCRVTYHSYCTATKTVHAKITAQLSVQSHSCSVRIAGFGDSDIYLQGNIGQQYLLCYYWVVATLTTNGQVGDMTPKSMLEVSPVTQHHIHVCVYLRLLLSCSTHVSCLASHASPMLQLAWICYAQLSH